MYPSESYVLSQDASMISPKAESKIRRLGIQSICLLTNLIIAQCIF